jgi:hypothetical protein
MNRLSKFLRAGYVAVGLSLAFGVAVPVAVYARGNDNQSSTDTRVETTTDKQGGSGSNFCSKLTSDDTEIEHGLSEKKGQKDAAETKRSQDVASDRAKWDQELKDNRTKWDAERQADFAKLEAKATTPAQTAAVKAYETTITNAVNTRRKANDTARAAFRAGVDNAIAAQKSTVSSQTSAFTTAVNAAIATAKASCAANPANAATIRSTLQVALKNARETFAGNRKDDSKLGDAIKVLAATRNAAIKANDTTFEATAKAARGALKAAFGSTDV